MKKYRFLFLCILLISSAPLFSQSETGIVESFKVIVKSVDDFFSTSPIILVSEDFSSSPSGKINYRIKFEKLATSFDVQKTTSLISPYTAYINLKLKASSNASRGDIKGEDLPRNEKTKDGKNMVKYWGFQSAADSIKNQDFLSCTDIESPYSTPDETYVAWCIGSVKLIYAFQDNTWVFKDADLPNNSRIGDGQTARNLRLNFLGNPEWKRVLLGKNE